MSDPTQPLLAERGITFFRRRYTSISEEEPRIARWRRSAREFLDSRWGHYLVLFLVTVDVCCSFSDFLIQLHVCELKQGRFGVDHGWEITQDVLSISSLVISCLLMVELIVSVLSFGMGYVGSVFDFVLDGLEFHGRPKGFHWTNFVDRYFSDYFHIFDSLVIVVAFTIEVSLRGIGEELGSLVIVLRLWRVFQIIEELSSAGEETLEQYEQQIERLQQENASLRQRLNLTSGENVTV